jgi:hypothetical protein
MQQRPARRPAPAVQRVCGTPIVSHAVVGINRVNTLCRLLLGETIEKYGQRD